MDGHSRDMVSPMISGAAVGKTQNLMEVGIPGRVFHLHSWHLSRGNLKISCAYWNAYTWLHHMAWLSPSLLVSGLKDFSRGFLGCESSSNNMEAA